MPDEGQSCRWRHAPNGAHSCERAVSARQRGAQITLLAAAWTAFRQAETAAHSGSLRGNVTTKVALRDAFPCRSLLHTGPDDGMVHGLGAGGERLHDWLGASDESAS